MEYLKYVQNMTFVFSRITCFFINLKSKISTLATYNCAYNGGTFWVLHLHFITLNALAFWISGVHISVTTSILKFVAITVFCLIILRFIRMPRTQSQDMDSLLPAERRKLCDHRKFHLFQRVLVCLHQLWLYSHKHRVLLFPNDQGFR